MTANDRTLVLFNYDWDASAFARLRGRWQLDDAGFDLFSFPSYLRLASFDLRRFVDRLAQRARRGAWRAVVSHHEQFGALGAALLAEAMGWPGTPVAAVLACQHKVLARQVLQRVAPEANLPFTRLRARYGEPIPHGLHYPAFAKPVKAAFSVLARRVSNHAQLTALTRFGQLEQWIIQRLVEPFDAIARERLGDVPSAHGMLLEEPVDAPQFNLDGYVLRGAVRAIGVVDAVMYPGTGAFQRFDRPSRLPERAQERALDVAARFLKAVGFDHGFFNMEFFYDVATDALKVIEFNPRLASQLADLYRRVDGIDAHAGSLALAHGQDPDRVMRCAPSAGAAASFVFRSFDRERVPTAPTPRRVRSFNGRFPDAWLQAMPKQGRGLARDFKWLGSHRYGVLHLGGTDAIDLHERYRRACALLGWPAAEARDLHVHLPTMPVARVLPHVEGVPT
ncbi:MAG TPA: ATP-grasp domain-containing protein [Burkholderiaceae bacterium]|nr:ATP-grasp domain-containing protein [Burkholderiaceae bacterium]